MILNYVLLINPKNVYTNEDTLKQRNCGDIAKKRGLLIRI
jgi:hypothetical protein